MPFFASQRSDSDSSLKLPASKRISAPTSQRLTTITEGGNSAAASDSIDPAPPIPRRSSRRDSGASHSFQNSKRWSGSTETTQRTAPPPYTWVAEPTHDDDGLGAIGSAEDEEKLARLRRGEGVRERKRGGWLRLGLITGGILLVIIALAVGLGVGLSQKKNSSGNSNAAPSGNNIPPQKFPLGQYSMVTALKTVDYGCTSNQATWRCWPYVVYSPSTNETSMASINMIIRSTADDYATASTGSTSDSGIPAKLTATGNDPFGISFTDKPLTYISPASNSSAARYTFSFTMSKTVVPSTAITPDNTNAKCFFNETVLTGTLYLNAARSYPTPGNQDDSSLGGYEQWPYAVEIVQSVAGGANVPDCYETTDGQVGARITYGLDPMPSTDQCLCDYMNFGL